MKRTRRKGGNKEKVFGCDLLEHLSASSQEIPMVLRCCSEFIEEHGIVDGIYRLSGVSSNTQRLRVEFDEGVPDLNKDVYLQDIHCVSSLCKAYFRELPNPLLTYQLYDKFAEAVAIHLEDERLVKIKEVLTELPLPHYRTLEYLMRHLVKMASYSSQTNMHARNLAIVWAPNLLRSKDIEASGFNGTAAFMEVRVQSVVVEFILTHVPQLFPEEGHSAERRQSLPSPALSIHDDKSPTLLCPGTISPGDGPPPMRPYHAIIEGTDKRKGSLKGRKWTSIFNLGGRLNERKSKGTRKEKEKTSLRPAKSMDSLSSGPYTQEGPRQQASPCHLTPVSPQNPCVSVGGESGVPAAPAGGLGSGYAVTYRRGGGASVSMVSGGGTPGTYNRLDSGGALTTIAVDGQPVPRSPAANSRAERRAGIHISGPFSVTVPLHITSGLALGVLQGAVGEKGEGAGQQKGDDKEVRRRERRAAEVQHKESREPAEEGGKGEENVTDNREGQRGETEHRLENSGDARGAGGTEEEQEKGNREDGLEATTVDPQSKKVTSEEKESKNGESDEEDGEEESSNGESNEEEHMDKEGDQYVDMGCGVSMCDDSQDLPLDFQDTFGFLDLMDSSTFNQMNEFSVEPPCYDMDEEDEHGSECEDRRSSSSSCHMTDHTSLHQHHIMAAEDSAVRLRQVMHSLDFDPHGRASKTQSLPHRAGLFLTAAPFYDDDDDQNEAYEDDEDDEETDKLFYSLPASTRLRTLSESGTNSEHMVDDDTQCVTSCFRLTEQENGSNLNVNDGEEPEADPDGSIPDLSPPISMETAEAAVPHYGIEEAKSVAQTEDPVQGDPMTKTHTPDIDFQMDTAGAHMLRDEGEGHLGTEEEEEEGLPNISRDNEESGDLAMKDVVCDLDIEIGQGEPIQSDAELAVHDKPDISEGSSDETESSGGIEADGVDETELSAEAKREDAELETPTGPLDSPDTSPALDLPLSDAHDTLPECSTFTESSPGEACSPSSVTEEHVDTLTEDKGQGDKDKPKDQGTEGEGEDQGKEQRQEPQNEEEKETESPVCDDKDIAGTAETNGEVELPNRQEVSEASRTDEEHKIVTEEDSKEGGEIKSDGGETDGINENNFKEQSVKVEPKAGEDVRSESGSKRGTGLGRTLVVSKAAQPKAKAVPVVPPKPEHSKLENIRQQLRQREVERGKDGERHREWAREPDEQGQGEAKRNSAISMCFDEAVARATERRGKERDERGREREKEKGMDGEC